MLTRLNQLARTAFLPVRCPPWVDDAWGGVNTTMATGAIVSLAILASGP